MLEVSGEHRPQVVFHAAAYACPDPRGPSAGSAPYQRPRHRERGGGRSRVDTERFVPDLDGQAAVANERDAAAPKRIAEDIVRGLS
jgi:hypothetical protein